MTIVLALVAIFWISPLVTLVITAIRPLADFISNGPLSWPETFTLQNFADAWAIGNFATTYRNSGILLLLKVPIGVLISAMLAYALAKLRIRFGTAIMYTVFLGLTIPIYITIVPVFVMMRSIGATDSLLGLVGPYLAFGIPFEVLVLQSFFRQLPDEIIEAAKIDGAGPWRIFFTLIIPLSTPALVTVFILDAVATWNEFLFALILLSSDAHKTIPVGTAELPRPVLQQQHRPGRRHPDRRAADPDRLHLPAALDRRRPHRRRHQGLTSAHVHRTPPSPIRAQNGSTTHD